MSPACGVQASVYGTIKFAFSISFEPSCDDINITWPVGFALVIAAGKSDMTVDCVKAGPPSGPRYSADIVTPEAIMSESQSIDVTVSKVLKVVAILPLENDNAVDCAEPSLVPTTVTTPVVLALSSRMTVAAIFGVVLDTAILAEAALLCSIFAVFRYTVIRDLQTAHIII